jgi:hypothetical protein
MAIEPSTHGLADMRIIVHNQNSPHRGLLHRFSPISTGLTIWNSMFSTANHHHFLISAAN